MAWKAAQTQGNKSTIASAVDTLLGTLVIKVDTTPTISMIRSGVDTIIAVIVYEQ